MVWMVCVGEGGDVSSMSLSIGVVVDLIFGVGWGLASAASFSLGSASCVLFGLSGDSFGGS